MNKLQAKRKIFDYFKKNSIEYKFINEELKLIDVDSLDTIYLCASVPDVIGGHIETCIRFREEHLYCQSYYCQPVVHNEEEAIRAARVINYLNKHLKYDCDTLYNHVYVLDEEEGDIFNGCLIRYELLEMYFQQSMNHILNFSVQQIADVCVPLIFYICGEWEYDFAIKLQQTMNSWVSKKGEQRIMKERNGKTSMVEVKMVKLRFPKVNVMAFSFWVMQYMDCVEILEGDLLKKTLKERMKWALENRIK